MPHTQLGAWLQGYDQEGVDDLVSGVLMGSYHSGGGGGPLIGGAMKHGLGFPWSGAVFAAVFAIQVGLWQGPAPRPLQERTRCNAWRVFSALWCFRCLPSR